SARSSWSTGCASMCTPTRGWRPTPGPRPNGSPWTCEPSALLGHLKQADELLDLGPLCGAPHHGRVLPALVRTKHHRPLLTLVGPPLLGAVRSGDGAAVHLLTGLLGQRVQPCLVRL